MMSGMSEGYPEGCGHRPSMMFSMFGATCISIAICCQERIVWISPAHVQTHDPDALLVTGFGAEMHTVQQLHSGTGRASKPRIRCFAVRPSICCDPLAMRLPSYAHDAS